MAAHNAGQRFLQRVLPRGVFESIEAGTRTFALECPCGHVRDLWEAGGVKYEGNQEKTLARCPACRDRTWQLKRKKTPEELREFAARRAQEATASTQPQVFLAARVWWFSVLCWGSAACVWAVPLFVPQLARQPAAYTMLVIGTFLLGWVAGPWFWFTTRYVIEGGELRLHSGPFSRVFQTGRIRGVGRERKGVGMSFATHTDFLWVDYSGGGAVISPKDRELFLEALGQVCPQLELRDGELQPR